ncbi:hypothetical protein H6P81_011954 [Aristolochia fimbriata]|uniref:Cell division cycle protein 123 homolog n=1 Tax=Aristolochia fimbriata TaxID=158543 RepID=A0AAV7EDA1_ARIFI|nr:hypothetical protein H6P81_011954 [Aristolochia fimbriata]
MKVEEISRCQIQEWYPQFKSYSFKTLIHELPQSFVAYLLDDSGPFLLPVSISGDDALPNRVQNVYEHDSLIPDEDSESSPVQPSFPELESEIKSSIMALGGAVFPKLNWSSPKDAAWISTTGTLKCTSLAEIALLLRSSDSIVHDLCHPFDSCDGTDSPDQPQRFFLALRKWYPSLRPEMEFRCFIRDQTLVGISQREVTGFYPILLEKKSEIDTGIELFFRENVKPKFKSENYVFDVYLMKDERVKIMDFGPYGAFTLPLMFTWEELEENYTSKRREIRIVENRCGVRPGLKTAVPYDYLDMSAGSGWDQFLKKADEEMQKQGKPT